MTPTKTTRIPLLLRTEQERDAHIDPTTGGPFPRENATIVFAALALLFTPVAVFAFRDDPWTAGLFVYIGIFSLETLSLIAARSRFGVKDDGLRYRLESSLTWFSPVPALEPTARIFRSITALGFIGFTAYLLIMHFGQGAEFATPIRALLLSIIFAPFLLWELIQALFLLRSPAGLRLSPTHIVAKQHSADARFTWDEIETITAEVKHLPITPFTWSRLVPALRIQLHDGQRVEIEAEGMGSDPNLVAAIMRFYLDRPEEREALKDPEEAFRRFRHAQARG